MVYWNRFISYIYRYHDGHKCENTGFAKVAKAGRTGRLTIGLKNGMNSREEEYGVYIYRETLPASADIRISQKNEVMLPVPVFIGRMRLRCGHGEECFTFDWNDLGGSGRPVTAFAGIAIRKISADMRSQSGYYSSDIFCSSWTDSVVDYSGMWEDKKMTGRIDMEETVAMEASTTVLTELPAKTGMPETEDSEVCEDEEIPDINQIVCGESSSEKAIDNMLENYERLPLLPGSSLDDGLGSVIESVKITPNDIGLLDMCNWKLGVNSFLTHGFYSYKYLMLGKVMFTPDYGRASYILGVPGVYSSREKYLAGIFGFERFVPEKETHIKTGNFGYWIVDIK